MLSSKGNQKTMGVKTLVKYGKGLREFFHKQSCNGTMRLYEWFTEVQVGKPLFSLTSFVF